MYRRQQSRDKILCRKRKTASNNFSCRSRRADPAKPAVPGIATPRSSLTALNDCTLLNNCAGVSFFPAAGNKFLSAAELLTSLRTDVVEGLLDLFGTLHPASGTSDGSDDDERFKFWADISRSSLPHSTWCVCVSTRSSSGQKSSCQ